MSLETLLQQLDEVADAMGKGEGSLVGHERTYAAFLLLSGAAPPVVAGILRDYRVRQHWGQEKRKLEEGRFLSRLKELLDAADEVEYQNLLAPLLDDLEREFRDPTFSDPDDSSVPPPP